MRIQLWGFLFGLVAILGIFSGQIHSEPALKPQISSYKSPDLLVVDTPSGQGSALEGSDALTQAVSAMLVGVRTSNAYGRQSLEALESSSDLIVVGTLEPVGVQHVDQDAQGATFSGFTVHTLVVREVYAGSAVEGQAIPLGEPYYLQNGSMVRHEEYAPCVVGQEYLFFLQYIHYIDNGSWQGAYFPTGYSKGRYPMDDPQLVMLCDGRCREAPEDCYACLYSAICDKYQPQEAGAAE